MTRYAVSVASAICLSLFCSIANALPISSYFFNTHSAAPTFSYTVLDSLAYQRNFLAARERIQTVLKKLAANRHESADQQIAVIVQQLTDFPYTHIGAMGEGDWQPASFSYQAGALHIQQDPVYRLDALDCQTFVQVGLSLFYSKQLADFDRNLIKIAYGAAGNPDAEYVRFYNRNHFVDKDWNRINHQNKFLEEMARNLASPTKQTSAWVDPRAFFLHRQKEPALTVRVLNKSSGPKMVKRLTTTYRNLPYPEMQARRVWINYLPKEMIARKKEGAYEPNLALLAQIPTPAVVEIVRDASKWRENGVPIKTLTGSESSVSHMGLLYRQTFQAGDLIYHKLHCQYGTSKQMACEVKPIYCDKPICHALVFAHATDAHPDHYYWYQSKAGDYRCTADPPAKGVPYSRCNRVEALPLFDYLTNDEWNGVAWYMQMPSILGIHVEKILPS